MLSVTVAFPFFIIPLLYCLQKKLETPSVEERISELYEGVRTESKAALLYSSTFIIRRLAFASILVNLSGYPAFQIIAFFNLSVLLCAYIVGVRPFANPALNRIEIFNEFCILLTAYHLVLFTDYVPGD